MEQIPLPNSVLRDTCRLCLGNLVTMTDIFSTSKIGEPISVMIMKCAPVQITKHDKMPTCICQLCYDQLENFRQFQTQIVQSDITLHHCLQQVVLPSDTKIEFVTAEDSIDVSLCDQIKSEYFAEGPSENTLNENNNSDITVKCESSEISDTLDAAFSWQDKVPQNSITDKEMSGYFQTEQETKNYQIFPTEHETVNFTPCGSGNELIEIGPTNSKGYEEKSEIYCFQSEQDLITTETILSNGGSSEIKMAVDTSKNFEYYPEIQSEDSDENSLCWKEMTSTECNNSKETTEGKSSVHNFQNGDELTDLLASTKRANETTDCDGNEEANIDINCQTVNRSKKFEFISLNTSKVFRNFANDTNRLQSEDSIQVIKTNCLDGTQTLLNDNLEDTNTEIDTSNFGQSGTLLEYLGQSKTNDKQSIANKRKDKKKPYQCDVCKEIFTDCELFEKHSLIHTHAKPYQCEICNKRFTTPFNLKTHNLLHTGEQPYQCNICNKRFTRLTHLRVHKLESHDERQHRCEVCNICFITSSDLKRHNLKHAGEKFYQCDICNKTFNVVNKLKLHKLVHTEEKPYENLKIPEKPYKCHVCSKRFTTFRDLKNHKFLMHANTPDACNKTFTTSLDLKQHVLTHTGDKPIVCNVCNKCFKTSYELNRHISIHYRERAYQCAVCSKRFTTAPILKKHSLVHMDRKKHQCGVCKKDFTQLVNLKKHIRVHTGEQPYRCEFCSKRFTNCSNLKIHILRHTGEKPYQCNVCNKRFTTSSDLKRHTLVHSEKKGNRLPFLNQFRNNIIVTLTS